ncbi:DUF3644 domain-containing protein [Bradyrhizobium commune]|uniref:DUF3644 domain-containing protein n=1 Tax=Bradyrhizobium commune TaxID=83627 RepID=A0A7S9GZD1_9BRAD|nr:DUF3644 domain-containing protein [Bradyrhizobium commune]QPF91469.1 DUF3644 domain-containing protein [Bradyrhizobium commune]
MRRPRYGYLVDKATQAAVAAIEVYNKPGFAYREETFAILMLNAWELLLKARVLKANRNKLRSIEVWEPKATKSGKSKRLAPKKNRAGNTMTIGVLPAANIVRGYTQDSIDDYAIENISLLMEVRDNAIHFHNVGRDLHKRVQEVGAAALRNFAFAAKKWFNCELSQYQFALMPVAFETPAGVIQTVFGDDTKGAAGKVAKLLADQERKFPFEAAKPFNVGVEVELKFVRNANAQAIPVMVSPNDPNAIRIMLTEEDILKRYPWDYRTLCKALKETPKFKENAEFHRLRKPLEDDPRFCRVRLLDPRNNKSSKQRFYSPTILAELVKHYT